MFDSGTCGNLPFRRSDEGVKTVNSEKVSTNLVSVSLSTLERLAGSVREMVTFVPGGENAVKAWYDYWGVLRRNHEQAAGQIVTERSKIRTKLSTYDKTFEYARKFAAIENTKTRQIDTGSFWVAGDLTAMRTDDPALLAEKIERRFSEAEENVIRPILKRMIEVPELIMRLVEGINAGEPPAMTLQSHRLSMDGAENFCFVTTMNRPDPLLAIRLCAALISRIPCEYEFFTDDVTSFESPDGFAWFYQEITHGKVEFTTDLQVFGSIAIPTQGVTTPVRSHLPLLLPDGGPGYRLVNSGGFATVEICRGLCADGDYFNSRLNEDEFSRITGYLVYLDSKGIINFRISQN